MRSGVITKERWGDGSICLITALLLVGFVLAMRYPPFILFNPRWDKMAVGLAGLTIGLPLQIVGGIALVITIWKAVRDSMTFPRVLGIAAVCAAVAWIYAPQWF